MCLPVIVASRPKFEQTNILNPKAQNEESYFMLSNNKKCVPSFYSLQENRIVRICCFYLFPENYMDKDLNEYIFAEMKYLVFCLQNVCWPHSPVFL